MGNGIGDGAGGLGAAYELLLTCKGGKLGNISLAAAHERILSSPLVEEAEGLGGSRTRLGRAEVAVHHCTRIVPVNVLRRLVGKPDVPGPDNVAVSVLQGHESIALGVGGRCGEADVTALAAYSADDRALCRHFVGTERLPEDLSLCSGQCLGLVIALDSLEFVGAGLGDNVAVRRLAGREVLSLAHVNVGFFLIYVAAGLELDHVAECVSSVNFVI